jgi:23S rRNA (guanosine2251-2'-O)-methyltransferase
VVKQKEKEVLFGFHPVIEAINARKDFVRILFKKGLKGKQYHECVKLAKDLNIPTQNVPVEKLNRITRANHQGVIAFISPIPYQKISDVLPTIYEEGRDPFLLLLDGITDIRNFGAITRSAEAAGVDAIIIGSKKAAMINSDAIKTSAGALNRVRVCREDDLPGTIKFLQESGIKLIGATEKATKVYYQSEMTGPMAIVMGAEDAGISVDIVKQLDDLVNIPMEGEISSLNVSVACGVLLFEALRQKKTLSI